MSSPKSRYPFAPIEEGAFFFVTDQGCYYTVDISQSGNRFVENGLLNNNGEMFEISFEKVGEGGESHDESIGGTILYILGSNMAAKGDTCVYFYVCDTSDGNGKFRARLFNWWYIHLQRVLPNLRKHNYIVPGFDNDEYDVSLFIFRNHPNYDDYTAEFERCLDENFSKQNYQ